MDDLTALWPEEWRSSMLNTNLVCACWLEEKVPHFEKYTNGTLRQGALLDMFADDVRELYLVTVASNLGIASDTTLIETAHRVAEISKWRQYDCELKVIDKEEHDRGSAIILLGLLQSGAVPVRSDDGRNVWVRPEPLTSEGFASMDANDESTNSSTPSPTFHYIV